MAKPQWGNKLFCPSCGAKFYDMKRNPAVCPKCETEVSPAPAAKTKSTPKREAEKPAKAPETPAAETADEDAALDDEPEDSEAFELDDDEDLIEDASDLDDDDEDVSEVKEHLEVDDTEK